VRIFLDNPILGVGTGGYQKAMEQFKDDPALPDVIQPHNSYLYMASSFGLVGLASLMWLFVMLLKKGWRNRDSTLGFSVLAFTLILVIGSLTSTTIIAYQTGTLMSVIAGIKIGNDEA
jgi:O-antigen ligase